MHRIEYHRKAEKVLRRIPPKRSAQIIDAIGELAKYPEPNEHPNVKKMRGSAEGAWRLRVGEYRVIFDLHPERDDEAFYLILVINIGSRGHIY